jgi:hypothetical protein
MAPLTAAERMVRLRNRRRHGHLIATVRVDQIEMRKLAALGYLDPAQREKGPALDFAAEAYLSDKLAEESGSLGAAP